jgi:hypothetical protein
MPLIAAAHNEFYMEALNEAHGQAMSSLRDYETAQASYQKSQSQSDVDKEQSSITQASSSAATTDKAKSTPPVVPKLTTPKSNYRLLVQKAGHRILSAQIFIPQSATQHINFIPIRN